MKFVKLSQRPRAGKGSVLQNQQENIPPGTSQKVPRAQNLHRMSQMDVQSMEAERKEEQQYLEEIMQYFGQLPQNLAVSPDYFNLQPDITQHMRQVLLNWLVDVHLRYKLQPQTLFITVHIIDAYLSAVVTPRTKLQLVGITALWIASKYEETYQVPKIDNLVFICDSTYSKVEILQMESNIIQLINFNLLFATELHYFDCINQIIHFQPKDYFLCRYILELCLFHVHFKKFHPKIIACSVAYFIRRLRRQDINWSQKQYELFCVAESDIKQCAREICVLWQQAQEIQNLNSLRIKFQSSHYKEVSKIKITQNVRSQPVGQLRA